MEWVDDWRRGPYPDDPCHEARRSSLCLARCNMHKKAHKVFCINVTQRHSPLIEPSRLLVVYVGRNEAGPTAIIGPHECCCFTRS
jgi:hypothetical protein